MELHFDLISDLNLSSDDEFDWSDKATALCCIVAGGISSDLDKVCDVLSHLSEHYRGVFYIDGALEHSSLLTKTHNIRFLQNFCEQLPNVVYLHNNVIIVDGVAVIGCNGWYGNAKTELEYRTAMMVEGWRREDMSYMAHSISRLQNHPDVKRIICVSNCPPAPELLYGDHSLDLPDQIGPALSLVKDVERKVSNWCFGTFELPVEQEIFGVTYLNNSYSGQDPYWAKRFSVDLS